jgi:hypothetical protein
MQTYDLWRAITPTEIDYYCISPESFAQPRRDLRDGVNVAPKEALFKLAKLDEIRM